MPVRPATAADLDTYLALFEAVAAEGLWLGAEAPVDRDRVRARAEASLTAPDAELLLAVEGEQVVGAMNLRAEDGIVSFGMFVVDGHRGRGVGRSLLDAGIGWAVDTIGAHKVTLEVWPHNQAALALYRSAGFEVEGRLRRQYRRDSGELWDCVLMGLVLDQASAGSPHRDDADLPR